MADNSSTALSPPKAANAGLCAVHAVHSESEASRVIQAMVTICTCRMRWRVFSVGMELTATQKDYGTGCRVVVMQT